MLATAPGATADGRPHPGPAVVAAPVVHTGQAATTEAPAAPPPATTVPPAAVAGPAPVARPRLLAPAPHAPLPARPAPPAAAAAAAGPFPRVTEPLRDLSLPQQRVRVLPAPPQLLALSRTLPALPPRLPPAAAQGVGPAAPQLPAARGQPPTRDAPKCSQCGQPRRKETGHFRHGRTYVCCMAVGMSKEDWLREMQEKDQG